jgi:RNA polymerase sigma-70 factor, ECF subfamily
VTGQVTLSDLMASTRQADEASTTATERSFDKVLADAVHEHARFIFKVAYSVLRSREDAEDAVQETFLRAMRHAGEFTKIENPRAWLARTAWRVAIDRTRKVRHASIDDDLNDGLLENIAAITEGPHAAAEALLINDQMLRLLRSFVSALPSELRDVVTLSTVNEMTSAEMSAVLGIPETSVRTRLFRARQLLKEKFIAVLERRGHSIGARK